MNDILLHSIIFIVRKLRNTLTLREKGVTVWNIRKQSLTYSRK